MRVFTVLQTWSYFYSHKNITLPKVDEKKEQDRITVPYPARRGYIFAV